MAMLAQTPPMGFNTWNTFGPNINEQMMLEITDVMVERGYRDAGYKYVVIDDCWSMRERMAMSAVEANVSTISPVERYIWAPMLRIQFHGSCTPQLQAENRMSRPDARSAIAICR